MHPPASASPHSDRPSSSLAAAGGPVTSAIGVLERVVLSLPSAMRTLVVVLVLAIGGVILYVKVVPRGDAKDPLRVAALYTNGIADPTHPGADTLNPQNVEAAHKAEEDGFAVRWHFDHDSEDHPTETAIDPANKIYYRYYANTDHCLYIRRRDGDSDHVQWVRDPAYHKHDVDKQGKHTAAPAPPRSEPASTVTSILARSFAALETIVSAASAQPNCVNPHPGQFRYWWGPPVDQCVSPMYRQFPDGCTHYQLYNRCANSWDSRINWTSCVAQHNR